MSDECNHGGLCYLESNRPVCCALCAALATNVTGTKWPNTKDDVKTTGNFLYCYSRQP